MPEIIPAGTYSSLTAPVGTYGQLSGSTVVNGPVVVSGGLNTNCQPLTGSGSFTLNAGGTLGICDPAGITPTGTASGAVQVSGTRSYSDDATYVYNAQAMQPNTGTGLPATVRALEVNLTSASAAIFLVQPLSVRREVRLTQGSLTLTTVSSGVSQPLTLLSDASGTALVVNSGTGVVSGTATVQRYIDASLNARPGLPPLQRPGEQHHRGRPGHGRLHARWSTRAYNDSATPGTTTPFPTVFGYDQSPR